MARTSRSEDLLMKVNSKLDRLATIEHQKVLDVNLAIVEKLLQEPDIAPATPLLEMFLGSNVAQRITDHLNEKHPLLPRLEGMGYRRVGIHHTRSNWWRSNEYILLQTALDTTSKKIWTDMHSPLKAFLERIDAAETIDEVSAAIEQVLKDLE